MADTRTGHVFVVHANDAPDFPTRGTVEMIDASSARVIRTLTVGHNPYTAAVDERTHRLFVVNAQDDSVSVLDTRTGEVLRTTGVGRGAEAVAIDERAGYVFVGNLEDNTVSVLDARTGRARGLVAAHGQLLDLAVASEIGRLYLIDWQALRILDTKTGGLVGLIAGTNPGLALDPAADRLFLVSEAETLNVYGATDGHLVRRLTGSYANVFASARAHRLFAIDDARGRLVVRDTRTLAIINTSRAPGDVTAIQVDDRLHRAFILDGGTAPSYVGKVLVLDAINGRVLGSVTVGRQLETMAIDPTRGRIFIANARSNTVSVLDAKVSFEGGAHR